MNCLHCNSETTNTKYCNRSCSAKHNNVLYPKRKTKKTCIECGERVSTWRKTRCDYHTEQYKLNKYKNMTLGEYRNRVSVSGKHPSWIHSHIRNFARTWLSHLRKLPCKHCGYDKHVELAHIKALSEFTDDTLLSQVNSEQNIIQLCPNCHWEFDNLPRKPQSRT